MDFAFATVQQREAIVGVAATDKLLDDFFGLQRQWTVRLLIAGFVYLEKMVAVVDQDSPQGTLMELTRTVEGRRGAGRGG